MKKNQPFSTRITRSGHGEKALARLMEKRSRARSPAAPSRSEIAYQQLREAIQTGLIGPNIHLSEVDLAAWLKMSRTPVREAMRRLESEGLLLNQPFRGAVVMTLDETHIRELYAVRELLEVAAVGWCAVHADESNIRAIREVLEQESTCLRNPRALIDLNRRFHQEICSGAHNQFLAKTLGAIQGSFALLGKSNLLSEDRARASHREHRAILDAIEKRDRKRAEVAARTHIQTSLQQRLKQYAKTGTTGRRGVEKLKISDTNETISGLANIQPK